MVPPRYASFRVLWSRTLCALWIESRPHFAATPRASKPKDAAAPDEYTRVSWCHGARAVEWFGVSGRVWGGRVFASVAVCLTSPLVLLRRRASAWLRAVHV